MGRSVAVGAGILPRSALGAADLSANMTAKRDTQRQKRK